MSQQAETELCFYARIGDAEALETAIDIEHHEQWEYKVIVEDDDDNEEYRGKVRIRRTERDGQVKFEETIKLPVESEAVTQGNHEYTVSITEEYFNAWKKLFGDKGYKKTRYVFLSKEVMLDHHEEEIKLPDIKYEVDVFFDQEGQRAKWCKIDIEIDDILAYLKEHHPEIEKFDTTVWLSKLPFKPEDAFSAVTDDDEQKEAIKAFWDRFAHHVKG